MENRESLVKNSIKASLNAFIEHIGLLITSLLLSFACVSLASIVAFSLKRYYFSNVLMLVVVSLLVGFISAALKLGIIRIYFDISSKNNSSLRQLFTSFNLSALYSLVATLLYLLLVVIGLIAFIVPGVFFAIRFLFFNFFILDRNAGPIESLRSSYRLTEGYSFKVLSLLLLNNLANLLSLIFIGSILFIVLGAIISFATLSLLDSSTIPTVALSVVGLLFLPLFGVIVNAGFGLAYVNFYRALTR